MFTWLEKALVIAVHDRQLSEHGGSEGIRDESLLESALARPQQLFAYGDPMPDMAALAAALTYGLARNHPFVDGNKRTAIVSAELFIELNEGALVASDSDLFPVILEVAQGLMSEHELAGWLRDHIRLQSDSIQEPAAAYKA